MFSAAEQLIVDRRYGDAIAFCMRELAASPRCVTLRLLLARALLARHQRKDAAAQLRECLLVDPSCVAAQSALADIAEQERLAAAAAAGQPVTSSAVRSFSALPSNAAIAERAKPKPTAVVVSDVPMVPKTPERTSPNSSAAAMRAAAQEDPAPLLVPAQSRLSARISVPHLVSPPAQSYPPAPLYEAEEMRTIVSAPPPQMPLGSSPSPMPVVERPISGLFSTGTPTTPFVPPASAPMIAAPAPVRLSSLYGGDAEPARASLYAGDQAPTNVAKSKPRIEPRLEAMAVPQKLPSLKPQIVRNRRRATFARDSISTPTAPAAAVDGRFLAGAPAAELPFGSRRKPLPGAAWLLVGLVASIPLWNRDRETTALPPAAMLNAMAQPKAQTPAAAPPPQDAAALEKAQLAELMRDIWVHPLPGPARRMPIRDSRVFGAERVGDRPSECVNGHCGVDIGSAYGEAVFAVHDGVIDRVQRGANADHGGHYVRIMHRGRTIVSQYFHLAAIPPQLDVGQTVKAGDIVGWVGRSGIKHSAPHLHFTIAVQEPNGDHARYIDPEPLIALWPLRVSAAGGDPLRLTAEVAPGTPRGGAHHHHHATVASAPTASATTDQE